MVAGGESFPSASQEMLRLIRPVQLNKERKYKDIKHHSYVE